MKSVSYVFFWLGAVALASSDASAQSAAPNEQAIDTVTIIGKKADAADVAGSAHVISQEELETYLNSDILRVLRSVPGVYVQEEEGFGLRPNIGIRGSGLDRSARIAVLEDGVLAAPAPYAASSAYYFPTQRRMSAVEVLKGPAAVSIGPRTTGGAINLISTPLPDAMQANLDVRGGDHGTLDAHVNVGNRGERVSWLLETVQAGSDGFKTIDGPTGGDTGYDVEDYIAKLQFSSDAASPLNQSLLIKLGSTDQRSNETYLGLTDTDFRVDPNRRYAATANDVFTGDHEQYQATYVLSTRKSWQAKITAYRNDFARNWYKLQSVGGANLNDVLVDPITYAAEYGYLTGTSSPDDALQIRANNRVYVSEGVQGKVEWDFGLGDIDVALNAGMRLHQDEEDRLQHQDGYRMQDGVLVLTSAGAAGSQTNRLSDAKVNAVFVDAAIRAGKWLISPGLRYEDIDMRRLDFATSDPSRAQGATRIRENSMRVFIPGVGAVYRVNADWRLLAGMNKGFNPPAPGSSASEESSLNLEAGARFDNGNLNFEAIFFRNDYDNLLGTVTDSTGGAGQVGDQFDGGEVLVSGLEMNASYDFAVGAFTIPLALELTWTAEAQFKTAFESTFEPWGDVSVGDELPYIPENQLRLSSGVEHEHFRINLAASYVGKMRARAGQGAFVSQESIDSHLVFDLMAAYNVSKSFAAYIKIDNLLDDVYAAARRPSGLRPGLPRSAYLGISYRL